MKADHRSPPSRSTLERMATSIGTDARRVAPRIEPRLRRAEHVPAGAVALSMGLDRTSVPMEESLPAGEAPATRRKTRRQPYERTPLDAVAVGERRLHLGLDPRRLHLQLPVHARKTAAASAGSAGAKGSWAAARAGTRHASPTIHTCVTPRTVSEPVAHPARPQVGAAISSCEDVGELAASHPIPIGVTRHVGVGLHDFAQGGHRGDEEVRRGDRHRGAQAQDSRSQ